MAEEFQGQESLPTWISKPEIRSKIASKLAEMQQQLDRTRGAIQAFKHLLLTNPKVVGEAATRDHPYVRPPVQRSLDDLKDRAISIVESMAYIQKMLRGTYGASNFKGYALAAMEKGDQRATVDARAGGINMPDSNIDYHPADQVHYTSCPNPADFVPNWVRTGR